MPGEDQQGGKQHDADAPDRNCPSQIGAGPGAFICGIGHIVSFSEGGKATLS
jgi:hypothetical protein